MDIIGVDFWLKSGRVSSVNLRIMFNQKTIIIMEEKSFFQRAVERVWEVCSDAGKYIAGIYDSVAYTLVGILPAVIVRHLPASYWVIRTMLEREADSLYSVRNLGAEDCLPRTLEDQVDGIRYLVALAGEIGTAMVLVRERAWDERLKPHLDALVKFYASLKDFTLDNRDRAYRLAYNAPEVAALLVGDIPAEYQYDFIRILISRSSSKPDVAWIQEHPGDPNARALQVMLTWL